MTLLHMKDSEWLPYQRRPWTGTVLQACSQEEGRKRHGQQEKPGAGAKKHATPLKLCLAPAAPAYPWYPCVVRPPQVSRAFICTPSMSHWQEDSLRLWGLGAVGDNF